MPSTLESPSLTDHTGSGSAGVLCLRCFQSINDENHRRYDDRFSERHPIFDQAKRERGGRTGGVMGPETREAILARPAESPGSAPIGKPDVPGDGLIEMPLTSNTPQMVRRAAEGFHLRTQPD